MRVQDLIDDLDTADITECSRIRMQLTTIGTEAIPFLIEAIRTHSGRKCWQAAKVLVAINGHEAIPILLEALDSPNLMLCQMAVELLEELGDSSVAPQLLKLLDHPKGFIRLRVIEALGVLRDQAAVEAMLSLLETSTSSAMRNTIIRALTRIGDQRALAAILVWRDDSDHHVRVSVLEAVHRFSIGESSNVTAH